MGSGAGFFPLVSLFRKRVSTLLLTISCLAVLQCVKMCCVLFQGRRRPSCDVLPKPSMNLFYTFGRGLSLMLALTIISNFHDNWFNRININNAVGVLKVL